VVPAPRTFEVVTADGRIRVLGTKFNVRTWDEGTSVYLESGSVGFSNDIGDVLLEPGFEANMATSASPIRVIPAETARMIGWTRNELILDETPLSEVVRELEHHYQIKLDLPAELAVQSVSGRFLLQERDRTLDQLRMITGYAFPIQKP